MVKEEELKGVNSKMGFTDTEKIMQNRIKRVSYGSKGVKKPFFQKPNFYPPSKKPKLKKEFPEPLKKEVIIWKRLIKNHIRKSNSVIERFGKMDSTMGPMAKSKDPKSKM